MCQSFYLLYYALKRGQNESYKKTLLDFAYFVNVLAKIIEKKQAYA